MALSRVWFVRAGCCVHNWPSCMLAHYRVASAHDACSLTQVRLLWVVFPACVVIHTHAGGTSHVWHVPALVFLIKTAFCGPFLGLRREARYSPILEQKI